MWVRTKERGREEGKEKEGDCGFKSLPVSGNSDFSLHASRKSQWRNMLSIPTRGIKPRNQLSESRLLNSDPWVYRIMPLQPVPGLLWIQENKNDNILRIRLSATRRYEEEPLSLRNLLAKESL